MEKIIKHRKIVGWGIGIFFFIITKLIAPTPTCNDGWESDSIGRRGACSHHRGVNNHSLYHFFTLIGSIITGVYTTYFLTPVNLRKDGTKTNNYIKLPCGLNNLDEHLEALRKNGIPENLIMQEKERLSYLMDINNVNGR